MVLGLKLVFSWGSAVLSPHLCSPGLKRQLRAWLLGCQRAASGSSTDTGWEEAGMAGLEDARLCAHLLRDLKTLGLSSLATRDGYMTKYSFMSTP